MGRYKGKQGPNKRKGNSDPVTGVRRMWGRGNKGTSLNHLGNSRGVDIKADQKRSKRGRYEIRRTRTFENITEKELEHVQVYAKQIVAEETLNDVAMIRLEEKSNHVGVTSRTEVYYVIVGQMVVGRISIRIQRLKEKNILRFIYFQKVLHK